MEGRTSLPRFIITEGGGGEHNYQEATASQRWGVGEWEGGMIEGGVEE